MTTFLGTALLSQDQLVVSSQIRATGAEPPKQVLPQLPGPFACVLTPELLLEGFADDLSLCRPLQPCDSLDLLGKFTRQANGRCRRQVPLK